MKNELHGFYLEDLEVGQTAVFAKTFTDADVTLYAGLSGDHNPIHINAEFAKNSRFKERIVHGGLTSSLISTVLGTKLPGPGAIFMSQENNFKAPVKIGDTVEALVRILEINVDKKRVFFHTQCSVNSTIVLEGKATIYVEKRA